MTRERWVPDRWDDQGRPWREMVGTPHPLVPALHLLPEVDETDLAQWEHRAEGLQWTFAATMPTLPHHYVVRGRAISTRAYYQAYALIAAYGETDTFHGRHRVYLYSSDGTRRWWVMSDYPQRSKIINMSEGEHAERGYGR